MESLSLNTPPLKDGFVASINDLPDWLSKDERSFIARTLRDTQIQDVDLEILKLSAENAKKNFLELVKKYFDGNTALEGTKLLLTSWTSNN